MTICDEGKLSPRAIIRFFLTDKSNLYLLILGVLLAYI